MQYYEVDHFVFNQDALTVLGDQGFKEVLTDNIGIIPKDILDDVLNNCFFLMLNKEKGFSAAFISKKLIEGKNICAFYEILYSKGRNKQVHMILHEIAHYVLGHSNEGLSDEDYYNHKQEKEANALVDKWINEWKKHLKTQEEKIQGKGGALNV
jgi:hypothetical protein